MARLSVACDVARLCADLELLAQAAERSLQIRERLLDLLDGCAQLVRVHAEGLPAGRADEFRIQFQLADGLRDLAAAVRAGEFDGLFVQQSGHGRPSQKVL